jgi:hypothetical protein
VSPCVESTLYKLLSAKEGIAPLDGLTSTLLSDDGADNVELSKFTCPPSVPLRHAVRLVIVNAVKKIMFLIIFMALFLKKFAKIIMPATLNF